MSTKRGKQAQPVDFETGRKGKSVLIRFCIEDYNFIVNRCLKLDNKSLNAYIIDLVKQDRSDVEKKK